MPIPGIATQKTRTPSARRTPPARTSPRQRLCGRRRLPERACGSDASPTHNPRPHKPRPNAPLFFSSSITGPALPPMSSPSCVSDYSFPVLIRTAPGKRALRIFCENGGHASGTLTILHFRAKITSTPGRGVPGSPGRRRWQGRFGWRAPTARPGPAWNIAPWKPTGYSGNG